MSGYVLPVCLLDINSLNTTNENSHPEINQKLYAESDRHSKERAEKKFSYIYKNSILLTKEIVKNRPSETLLTKIFDNVFDKWSHSQILRLLEAISTPSPPIKFSKYDQIRFSIAKDVKMSMNNASLRELLKENKCIDKLNDCYQLAFQLNHANIYPESQEAVDPEAYTLNFLWVNLNPQDRTLDEAENIFNKGLNLLENGVYANKSINNSVCNDLETEKKIKQTFSYRLAKWAALNPGSEINLWHDSALVTPKAQKNTFEVMKSISKSTGVNLKLRDIRQLPNIQGEIENCLHPATPVYFRVDLLKSLIADNVMSTPENPRQFCIVSDIDIRPMSSKEMFDQRTLDFLSSDGYVFNRLGRGKFENSFFIFNNQNEKLKETHRQMIIDEVASKVLNFREAPLNTNFSKEDLLCSEFVYYLYEPFLTEMGEGSCDAPRKVVKCPKSRFSIHDRFTKENHEKETFRFIGSSNVPYTVNGRNYNLSGQEGQIEALKNWVPEPHP